MNKLGKAWQFTGRVAYWLMTPGLALALPFTKRTRVLLVCGHQVLVVRGWLSDGRWQLPGGGLHHGEEPAAGALRELREETGLSLPADKFAEPLERQFREGAKRFRYYLYVLEVGQAVPVRPRWPELTAARWVDIGSLDRANAGSDVTTALEVWKG